MARDSNTRPSPRTGPGTAQAGGTSRPPQIPMASDVAALVGDFAEEVQNRSLLLDKYVFHKKWGLDDFSANDAHKWSLMRVSDGGPAELLRDARRRNDQAGGRNVDQDKAAQLRRESGWATRLSSTKAESRDAQDLRRKHSRNLVSLFHSAYGDSASVTVARLKSRMAIDLADGLIQNAGIALDRIFGLPFIPGSAVKGVCRHAALAQIHGAADRRPELLHKFCRIFGTSENDYERGELAAYKDQLKDMPGDLKGSVTFLPAYPVDDARVVVDLTTVHYPNYYRTGEISDLANEKPLPNPFPAVESGSGFAFLLLLNRIDQDKSLLAQAESWLKEALTVCGLGAKTSAGYGWFEIDMPATQQLLESGAREADALEQEAQRKVAIRAAEKIEQERLASLSPEQKAAERFAALSQEEFAAQATKAQALSPEEQKGLLAVLTSNKEQRDIWKRWGKSDKPASKARVELLRKLAAQYGVNMP